MVECGGVYILPLVGHLYYPAVRLPALRNLASDCTYSRDVYVQVLGTFIPQTLIFRCEYVVLVWPGTCARAVNANEDDLQNCSLFYRVHSGSADVRYVHHNFHRVGLLSLFDHQCDYDRPWFVILQLLESRACRLSALGLMYLYNPLFCALRYGISQTRASRS